MFRYFDSGPAILSQQFSGNFLLLSLQQSEQENSLKNDHSLSALNERIFETKKKYLTEIQNLISTFLNTSSAEDIENSFHQQLNTFRHIYHLLNSFDPSMAGSIKLQYGSTARNHIRSLLKQYYAKSFPVHTYIPCHNWSHLSHIVTKPRKSA